MHLFWRFTISLALLSSYFCSVLSAVNRTIDDTYGDSVTGQLPVYSPRELWKDGENCSTCSIKPHNPEQTFQQTWKDTTQLAGSEEPHTLAIDFNGTAIYVFGVMDNNQGSFVAQTKLSISLDGHPVGEFLHVPDGTSGLNGYEYNVVVYANHSIPNGEHRLIVSTIAESKHSVFLFDYAIYTYEGSEISREPTSSDTSIDPILSPTTAAASASSNSRLPAGAIAGGISVGLSVLIIALIAFLLARRRRQRKLFVNSDASSPFVPGPKDPTLPVTRVPSRMHSQRTYRTDTTESFFPTSAMLPSPVEAPPLPAMVISLPMGLENPSSPTVTAMSRLARPRRIWPL